MAGWPPQSSDLNPIEQLWSLLKRRVSERGPWGVEQLKSVLREEWDRLPQSTVNNYVVNFDKKLTACAKAKGQRVSVGGKKNLFFLVAWNPATPVIHYSRSRAKRTFSFAEWGHLRLARVQVGEPWDSRMNVFLRL